MVVVAYGQILPKSVLELPRLGCLNLHASLLPRHRGASPIHAAILAGDANTGMTVMYMDEGLDTGDALLERSLAIGPQETTGELHDRLADIAAPCLLDALDLLAAGTAPRSPQDSKNATYAPKLKKADGWLDWNKSSQELALRIRAMSPWPGAFARISGHLLKIHAATAHASSGLPGEVLQADADSLVVACATGSLSLVTRKPRQHKPRSRPNNCLSGCRGPETRSRAGHRHRWRQYLARPHSKPPGNEPHHGRLHGHAGHCH